MKLAQGFTLIELMVVMAIIALFAAIAIPSYQEYARRTDASRVMQEMLRIAELAERYKARNFNYQNFSSPTINWPRGYAMTLSTQTNGLSWSMKVITDDVKNYSFLMDSRGNRCKTKTSTNITSTGCGASNAGSESW